MIDITPDPVFVRILGFPIYWYGLAYAVGLAAVYVVVVREARFRGLDETRIGTGMIILAAAALIGGRLYHVIDRWQLYAPHPITAILPLAIQPDGSYTFAGFTGLGVPGGIIAGTIAGVLYARRVHEDIPRWADVVAPGLSSCRRSVAGGTSSTRSCTGRRRRCRGASGSTVPTASRTSRARSSRWKRRTSIHCSCTSPCPASSVRWS
ncbi:MAG: prolipoprotein diacylglyceryl transferase [Chloroflexi bacterium]|nr:MAG: prolipoprotein diacylglyceryl transferase [Chloroflexota bacterium]